MKFRSSQINFKKFLKGSGIVDHTGKKEDLKDRRRDGFYIFVRRGPRVGIAGQ